MRSLAGGVCVWGGVWWMNWSARQLLMLGQKNELWKICSKISVISQKLSVSNLYRVGRISQPGWREQKSIFCTIPYVMLLCESLLGRTFRAEPKTSFHAAWPASPSLVRNPFPTPYAAHLSVKDSWRTCRNPTDQPHTVKISKGQLFQQKKSRIGVKLMWKLYHSAKFPPAH